MDSRSDDIRLVVGVQRQSMPRMSSNQQSLTKIRLKVESLFEDEMIMRVTTIKRHSDWQVRLHSLHTVHVRLYLYNVLQLVACKSKDGCTDGSPTSATNGVAVPNL